MPRCIKTKNTRMGLLRTLFGFGRKPAKKKSRRKAKRVGGGFVPSDVGGSAASIVLADIDGAGGDKITEHLASVFAAISDVAVFRRSQTIKLNTKAPLFNALQEAARTGSEWLRDDEADLLVWGGTVDLGTAVELRFLPVGAAELYDLCGTPAAERAMLSWSYDSMVICVLYVCMDVSV